MKKTVHSLFVLSIPHFIELIMTLFLKHYGQFQIREHLKNQPLPLELNIFRVRNTKIFYLFPAKNLHT